MRSSNLTAPPSTQARTTAPAHRSQTAPAILDGRQLLELIVQAREYVLEPILHAKETATLYGYRGFGKTYLLLTLAYAIACGGMALKWRAPKARRVLYVDGELPIEVLQERLRAIVAGAEGEPPEDSYFRLLAADQQELGIPNLSTAEGREWLEPHLKDVEVLFLDSISTL